MRRPHRTRRALIAFAAAVLLFLASANALVQYRISLARAGAGAIGEPTPIEKVASAGDGAAGGSDGSPSGTDSNSGSTGTDAGAGTSTDSPTRFEVTADYASIVAEDGAEAHSTFTWDDAWFFQDPTAYNGELARACAVFSSVANCESSHYQQGSNVPAYMEQLLAKLGFENVSTASYRYRSEIVDQVANVFTPGGTDTTAYSIASKHVTDPATGKKKLLVMVAVRGSYGTEWLSNLRFKISGGIVEGFGVGAGDHEGFSDAALDITNATYQFLESVLDEDGGETLDDVCLLFCGHSRGGATANICASYLDQISSEVAEAEQANPELAGASSVVAAASIYCYTFATPGVTDAGNCRASTYDNIFNVLNPADIVPRMPLASWGFERYGHDLWLPESGMDGFGAIWQEVRGAFVANIGCDTKADPTDVDDIDQIVADLEGIAPTADDFSSPVTVAKTLGALVMGHDVVRIVNGHAPDLYDAWLSVVDASQLRTSR